MAKTVGFGEVNQTNPEEVLQSHMEELSNEIWS
jgi:hypothetical protein